MYPEHGHRRTSPLQYTVDMPEKTRTDDRTHELDFISEVLRTEAQGIDRLAQAVSSAPEAWCAALDVLEACTGHVVVSGMGKSGLVGGKISATFSSLGQPSNFVHPSEAVHGDGTKLSTRRPGFV